MKDMELLMVSVRLDILIWTVRNLKMVIVLSVVQDTTYLQEDVLPLILTVKITIFKLVSASNVIRDIL